MRATRVTITIVSLVLSGSGSFGDENRRPDRPETAADRWNSVKFAVARESVASHLRFFRSLQSWVLPEAGKAAPESGGLGVVDTDATPDGVPSANPVVHIRGDLASTLRVDGHSEVVIGGSILVGGRIEADGIAVVHVQGDVDGVVACSSMAAVWVGGSVRGEVLTGTPSMHLHVVGDLLGVVRPIADAALLYVDVGGQAGSTVVAAIDRYRYTELQIATGTSDLGPGIHRLSTGSNGFVAVAGFAVGR